MYHSTLDREALEPVAAGEEILISYGGKSAADKWGQH